MAVIWRDLKMSIRRVTIDFTSELASHRSEVRDRVDDHDFRVKGRGMVMDRDQVFFQAEVPGRAA